MNLESAGLSLDLFKDDEFLHVLADFQPSSF